MLGSWPPELKAVIKQRKNIRDRDGVDLMSLPGVEILRNRKLQHPV